MPGRLVCLCLQHRPPGCTARLLAHQHPGFPFAGSAGMFYALSNKRLRVVQQGAETPDLGRGYQMQPPLIPPCVIPNTFPYPLPFLSCSARVVLRVQQAAPPLGCLWNPRQVKLLRRDLNLRGLVLHKLPPLWATRLTNGFSPAEFCL
jgi:hypothetical protein